MKNGTWGIAFLVLDSEATIVTENPRNALEIANQALEIAQNPRINNTYLLCC